MLKADASPDVPAWIDSRIAEACDVSVVTVENLRKSYVLEGLEATIERKKQYRLSRQCFCQMIADAATVRQQVAAWESDRNAKQKGVDWQFTIADGRIKPKTTIPKDSKLTLH